MSDRKKRIQEIVSSLRVCTHEYPYGISCVMRGETDCQIKLMTKAANFLESLQRQQEQQEPEPLDAFQINHMIGKPVFSGHDGEWHIISEFCSINGDRIRVRFTDGESVEASEKTLKLYATEPKGDATT